MDQKFEQDVIPAVVEMTSVQSFFVSFFFLGGGRRRGLRSVYLTVDWTFILDIAKVGEK